MTIYGVTDVVALALNMCVCSSQSRDRVLLWHLVSSSGSREQVAEVCAGDG